MTEATAEATEEAVMQPSVTANGNEAHNADIVHQAYEQGFNAGSDNVVRKLYSPDFVSHNPDGTTQTLDEFITSFDALPGGQPAIPPTNKPLSLGMSFLHQVGKCMTRLACCRNWVY